MRHEPLGVAVVGLGRWSYTIAAAIQSSPLMRLVTCYTRTPAKREAFSQKFGCGREESYESVLRNPGVEAVVLVTPNNAHAEQTIQAAAHGKHVRVDKPIATTIADARAMMRACDKAGVALSVAAPYRFTRGMRLFRKMVAEGALGRLAMAEANYSNDRGYYYTPQDWQWYSSGSPGGPLIQVAVHQLDSLYYLFGPVRRASAKFSKVMTKSEIPDVCVLWLEFESGLLGTLGTSFVSPTAKKGRFTLFLNAYGSEANLYHDRWDGLFILRREADDKERVPLEEYPGQGHIQANLEDFARAVREGRPPEVGGPEGLHILAVIQAAMRSAETGRPVEVKEVLTEE